MKKLRKILFFSLLLGISLFLSNKREADAAYGCKGENPCVCGYYYPPRGEIHDCGRDACVWTFEVYTPNGVPTLGEICCKGHNIIGPFSAPNYVYNPSDFIGNTPTSLPSAPTCTQPGLVISWEYYECTNGTCVGKKHYKIKSQTFLPPIGHNFGAWEYNDGVTHKRTCQNSCHDEAKDGSRVQYEGHAMNWNFSIHDMKVSWGEESICGNYLKGTCSKCIMTQANLANAYISVDTNEWTNKPVSVKLSGLQVNNLCSFSSMYLCEIDKGIVAVPANATETKDTYTKYSYRQEGTSELFGRVLWEHISGSRYLESAHTIVKVDTTKPKISDIEFYQKTLADVADKLVIGSAYTGDLKSTLTFVVKDEKSTVPSNDVSGIESAVLVAIGNQSNQTKVYLASEVAEYAEKTTYKGDAYTEQKYKVEVDFTKDFPNDITVKTYIQVSDRAGNITKTPVTDSGELTLSSVFTKIVSDTTGTNVFELNTGARTGYTGKVYVWTYGYADEVGCDFNYINEYIPADSATYQLNRESDAFETNTLEGKYQDAVAIPNGATTYSSCTTIPIQFPMNTPIPDAYFTEELYYTAIGYKMEKLRIYSKPVIYRLSNGMSNVQVEMHYATINP